MEEIPYKNYEEIRKIANGFLAEYHPSGGIPVPIEDIVEFQLKLDIIPIPGLRKLIETDGLTYGNKKSIAVDESVYDSRPTRYRFTLAHETGHLIIHPQCFDSGVDSTGKWKDYINGISDQQYRIMEWQANCFAGLALVPADKLKEMVPEAIEHIRKLGDYPETSKDFIWEIIRDEVASYFDVSNPVIHIRMERDNLYRLFNKDV
jgi:hypothetical protein